MEELFRDCSLFKYQLYLKDIPLLDILFTSQISNYKGFAIYDGHKYKRGHMEYGKAL